MAWVPPSQVQAPKATDVPPIHTGFSRRDPMQDSGVGASDEEEMERIFNRFGVSSRTAVTPALATRSPKVVLHFIRHAQALHNVLPNPPAKRVNTRDPCLTQHGIDQCCAVREGINAFPYMDKIKYILCSPMKRTLETTLHAFGPLLCGPAGLKAIAWDDLREHGRALNNTGTTLQELKQWNEDHGLIINLDILEQGWEVNSHDTEDDRSARSLRVRQDLYLLSNMVIGGGVWKGIPFPPHKGPENVEILVVSHGGFLSSFLGHGRDQVFHNVQWKSYKFASVKKMLAFRIGPMILIEKKASVKHKHVKFQPKRPAKTSTQATGNEGLARYSQYPRSQLSPHTSVFANDAQTTASSMITETDEEVDNIGTAEGRRHSREQRAALLQYLHRPDTGLTNKEKSYAVMGYTRLKKGSEEDIPRSFTAPNMSEDHDMSGNLIFHQNINSNTSEEEADDISLIDFAIDRGSDG